MRATLARTGRRHPSPRVDEVAHADRVVVRGDASKRTGTMPARAYPPANAYGMTRFALRYRAGARRRKRLVATPLLSGQRSTLQSCGRVPRACGAALSWAVRNICSG
jgi:hypothetical protein